MRRDSAALRSTAARLSRDNARTAERRRTSACCRSPPSLGPLEGTSFSRNGPDCAHRWRPRSIGRIVSSTLVARSSSSTSLLTWVARTMIRRSLVPSRSSPATPGSCFLRRETMILPALTLYTCGRTDTTNMPRAIRRACRSFTPRHRPARPPRAHRRPRLRARARAIAGGFY